MSDLGDIKRLDLVLELVSELATVSDIDGLLLSLSTHLPQVLDIDALSFARVGETGAQYWHFSRASTGSGWSAASAAPEGREALLDQCIQQGAASSFAAEQLLGYALSFDGRIVGAMVLGGPAASSYADMRVMHHIANCLGSALGRLAPARVAGATAEDRAKDAQLAHELRTPLSAIKLWGGLLRSGEMSGPELERAVDAILASAANLGKLIAQLLDHSRLVDNPPLVAEPPQPLLAADESASVGVAAAPFPSRALEGITVLVAEDDPYTLLAMQTALAQAGARVLPAESASAALELAEREDAPDRCMVLVSDLCMPRMSGYELVVQLALLRNRQQRSAMPACAVTAHAHDSERQRALDAGFDLFLSKPITPEQLVRAVFDLGRAEAAYEPSTQRDSTFGSSNLSK